MTTSVDKETYITVKEAAELIGKSDRTIYRWIKRGIIAGRRMTPLGEFYIARSEIPNYLRSRNEK
jgi:excisionase family DNA binding protein